MAHRDLFPPDQRHSLAYFLARYPTLNQPNPEPLTNALSILSTQMDTRPFHDDHAGASMLCHHLPMMLTTIPKRQRQKKRALGGKSRSASPAAIWPSSHLTPPGSPGRSRRSASG